MYLPNIDKLDLFKTIVPFVIVVSIFIFRESIGGFITEKLNLKNEITYPQILNKVESVKKLTTFKQESLNAFAIGNLLIDEKFVKSDTKENQKLNLPELSEILKNQPSQSIPEKKEVPILQAVFISDKLKFAVINGKVVKEGHMLDNIKVLSIQDKKVFIQEKSGGKLWLFLNQ